jgi:hypothetical protein
LLYIFLYVEGSRACSAAVVLKAVAELTAATESHFHGGIDNFFAIVSGCGVAGGDGGAFAGVDDSN